MYKKTHSIIGVQNDTNFKIQRTSKFHLPDLC